MTEKRPAVIYHDESEYIEPVETRQVDIDFQPARLDRQRREYVEVGDLR